MSRAVKVLLLFVACLGLAFFLPSGEVEQGSIEAAGRPNIVLILTDDLDVASVSKIPALKEDMADEGVTFDNAFVTESVCCPSRSSMLTGQYPHNHLVRRNSPPLGGFESFRDLDREDSTIATWLDSAGYETALFGKYLNGYGLKRRVYVPPGWDEWYGAVGDRALNHNGEPIKYPEESYHDDVLSGLAQDFVRRQEGSEKPFFMYVSVHAPHEPANPAPRHEDLFKGVQAPRTAAFNEADASDKPKWVQRSSLSSKEKRYIDQLYRDRLRTMVAVGEMTDGLLRTLKEAGELDNTYLIFTSDNGYHMGQHRLSKGKGSAYEEDIRIPLMIRGPGVPAGIERDEMVLNNDFAPTFADLAGLPQPAAVDGRSFAPLLDGEAANDPASWRTAFEVRYWHDKIGGVPSYDAVRTQRHLYVEYEAGERELYDLKTDPYELQNLHDSADPALISDLDSRLAALRDCSGDECRAAEDAPPGP
jgi:N-acetylglucosamine-6-sulfatase